MNPGTEMTESHITLVADALPSTQLVEAVAELEDVDQVELPPLLDAIDPESLNTIAREYDATVSFQYCDYSIEVRGTTEMIIHSLE